jgi:hypothetical protein
MDGKGYRRTIPGQINDPIGGAIDEVHHEGELP